VTGTVSVRSPIVATLSAGALLTLLLVVSLILWLVLGMLGDESGAIVARVIALLVGICWCLDFVALVVLLAFAQLGFCGNSNSRVEQE